jgi:NAD-dependent protein deacetylase/lipoamidase
MQIGASAYKRIVVLTGAGVSVASGLRPYCGPGGVWEEQDLAHLGHADALIERPRDTWDLFGGMREPVLTARPNAAHVALARWEANLRSDQEFLLITQNVDGLHQQAGSRNVSEIHGNIMYTRCSNFDCTLERFRDIATHHDRVPTCTLCGQTLRPDVVLFGEELPVRPSWVARRALYDCDLFLAIGTSGTVEPASNFARGAAHAGARTICLNLEPMQEPNPAFQEEYRGRAEELLPRLIGLD